MDTSDKLQVPQRISAKYPKRISTARDVKDVFRVIHDMSIFVVLATCREELDAVPRIRRVNVTRYKRKFHDPIPNLGRERWEVDLASYWRSITRHGGGSRVAVHLVEIRKVELITRWS